MTPPDSLQSRYDETPYHDQKFVDFDLLRLLGMAELFGLRSPNVDAPLRVLDLAGDDHAVGLVERDGFEVDRLFVAFEAALDEVEGEEGVEVFVAEAGRGIEAAKALDAAFDHLHRHGSSVGIEQPLYDLADMHALMGFEDVWAFDRKYGR